MQINRIKLLIFLVFISLCSCTQLQTRYLKKQAYDYLDKQAYDKAIPYFKKLIHIKPHDKKIILDLKKIYETAGYYYIDHKEYDSAIPYFKELIQLEPNNKNAVLALGKIYEIKGFYDAAIVYYTDAIKIDTSFAKAYSSLGYAYSKLNKIEESNLSYLKSLEIEPDNITILSILEDTYQQKGDLNNARKYYYKILEIDSTRYGDMYDLARMELHLGNYEMSTSLCLKIMKYSDNQWDGPLSVLASNYMAMAMYKKAIVYLFKAIDYNSNSPYHYNDLGYCYSVLNKNERAIEFYNKAIGLDFNNPGYFLNRANSKSLLGLYKSAIKDYDEAISLSNNKDDYFSAIGYNNRATIKMKLGDTKGFMEDRKKAKEFGYTEKYKPFSNFGENTKLYSKKNNEQIAVNNK